MTSQSRFIYIVDSYNIILTFSCVMSLSFSTLFDLYNTVLIFMCDVVGYVVNKHGVKFNSVKQGYA